MSVRANLASLTLLGAGLVVASSAFGGSGVVAWKARDLVIPIFVSNEPKAVGALRIGNVFTEYERKGFFRIGALPKLVCDQVRLELRQLRLAGIALEQSARELKSGPSHALVEWRAFSIVCGGEVTPRLHATRARLAHDGAWELQGNVSAHTGTNTVKLNRAVLRVQDGGRVVVAGNTHGIVMEIVLFDPDRPESQEMSSTIKQFKESK